MRQLIHLIFRDADENAELIQKISYVLQMGLEYTINLFIINFPVDMNQPVSKSGHLYQTASIFFIKSAPFSQHSESIGIIFGRSVTVFLR